MKLVFIMEKWPDFFIVGAAKSGTTSLYEYLVNTPNVYMSTLKEPNYFSTTIVPDDSRVWPIRNKQKYLDLFKNATEDVIGEASPTYLPDPNAAKSIHQIIPNAKIIMILRNPVDRAFSHYSSLSSRGLENASFREALNRILAKKHKEDLSDYINFGMYYNQVKRYLDTFDHVKIYIFEEFFKDVKENVNEVLKFLQVDSKVPDIKAMHNPFKVARTPLSKLILRSKTIVRTSIKFVPQSVRWKFRENVLLKEGVKPSLLNEDRDFLIELYRDDVKNLENLLKIKLPWL